MSISGSLQDVAVSDVLQFIHLGKRTGTLELERDGERARFGCHEGSVISAQAPGAPRLGELLLAAGHVNAEVLADAMTNQTAGGRRRSLGQILVESGQLRLETLQEVVKQQLERAVEKVLGWERGTFDFAIDEIRPVDDIGVETTDFVKANGLAANVVLLEAARIFDERDRLGPPETLAEAAVAALTAADDEERETPRQADAVPLASTDPGVRRLQRMLSELRSGFASATVALDLMQLVSESFERATLLLVKRDRLGALGAFGMAANGSPLAIAIRRLEIVPSGVLLSAIASSQVQGGRFADADLPGALAAALGQPAHDQIVVFPVAGTERVIAVVYADNGEVDKPLRDVDLLEVAASQVGIAFENELLRRQLGKS